MHADIIIDNRTKTILTPLVPFRYNFEDEKLEIKDVASNIVITKTPKVLSVTIKFPITEKIEIEEVMDKVYKYTILNRTYYSRLRGGNEIVIEDENRDIIDIIKFTIKDDKCEFESNYIKGVIEVGENYYEVTFMLKRKDVTLPFTQSRLRIVGTKGFKEKIHCLIFTSLIYLIVLMVIKFVKILLLIFGIITIPIAFLLLLINIVVFPLIAGTLILYCMRK